MNYMEYALVNSAITPTLMVIRYWNLLLFLRVRYKLFFINMYEYLSMVVPY